MGSSGNEVVIKIKALWESSNTFEVVSQQMNGARDKAKVLNSAYRDQSKSIGELKEKINEWRKASDNSYRSDHIRKYNGLVSEAKKRIEELEGAANKCKDKTESIFRSVFNAQLLMRGLSAAKGAVTSFVKDSVDSYQRHNVARTQLEQVMKNSMGSGKWGVDEIVEVTKAQSKLGVVGREVQLSGAKELGTYLRKEESLKKLLPVMNDMLAHQYGLNATQENAQGIAQMMGKVLDGQTAALSRNGYTFTDAQAKILEYGTESERVAVLAEVVSNSVSGVNEALGKTPEGKVKQVAEEYEEVKMRIGELSTKVGGGVSQVFQKFTISLYNNREMILGITKGIGAAAAGFAAYKVTALAAANASKISAAAMAAKGFVVNLLTGKIKLATIATKAMNAAMRMNPVGLLIGVVSAAITAFTVFRKKTDENTEAMKRAQDTAQSYYAQEKTNLDIIFEKLRKTNPKSKERNELVDELKRMYPDLNEQLLTEIRNTNDLSGAYDVLIGKIQQRAKSEALRKTLTDLNEQSAGLVLAKQDFVDDVVKKEKYTNEEEYKKQKSIAEKHFDDLFENLSKRDKAYELYTRNSWNIKAAEQLETYGLVKSKGKREGAKSYENTSQMKVITGNKEKEEKIARVLAELDLGSGRFGGGGTVTNPPKTEPEKPTSLASDLISGGGRSMKNITINMDSLIRVDNQHFQKGDDPGDADDFNDKVMGALMRILNDVNMG